MRCIRMANLRATARIDTITQCSVYDVDDWFKPPRACDDRVSKAVMVLKCPGLK